MATPDAQNLFSLIYDRLGKPSWVSELALSIAISVGLYTWQRIRSMYKYIDEQMPKNDDEQKKRNARVDFIDDLMKKNLLERRDFESFSSINMIEHQNIGKELEGLKDGMNHQLESIQQQIQSVITIMMESK